MNRTSFLLAIGLVGVLVLANARIIHQTWQKHQFYAENPPFFGLDFTRLHTLSRSSHVYYLTDRNPNTFWTKGAENGTDFDFDTELKLSHWMVQSELTPRQFSHLEWTFCKPNPESQKIQIELYEREAINIDGEKRLPEDKLFWKGEIETTNLSKYSLPLADKIPKWEKATRIGKDSGVWIVGIRAKTLNPNTCISEIQLLEN